MGTRYFLDTVSQIQEEPGPRVSDIYFVHHVLILDTSQITFSITIAFSAGTDILIAGILVYLLHQSRTGYKEYGLLWTNIPWWLKP